jgi:hypothetical protein
MKMMSGGLAIVLAVLGCLLMMGAMAVIGWVGARRRRDRRLGDSHAFDASDGESDGDVPGQQERVS